MLSIQYASKEEPARLTEPDRDLKNEDDLPKLEDEPSELLRPMTKPLTWEQQDLSSRTKILKNELFSEGLKLNR